MKFLYEILKNFFSSLLIKFKHMDSSIHILSKVKKSKLNGNHSIYKNTVVENCELGKNTIISEGVIIKNSSLGLSNKIYDHTIVNNLKTGRYTYINVYSIVSNTEIGSFCSIGPKTVIGGGMHPHDYLSSSPVLYSDGKQCGFSFVTKSSFTETKNVKIGHDVWIGANCYISDGVTIENGAIVAAGSVVTKDVAAYSIVGGVPAKLIKNRFNDDTIAELKGLNWWDWDSEKIEKNIKLFNAPFEINQISNLK